MKLRRSSTTLKTVPARRKSCGYSRDQPSRDWHCLQHSRWESRAGDQPLCEPLAPHPWHVQDLAFGGVFPDATLRTGSPYRANMRRWMRNPQPCMWVPLPPARDRLHGLLTAAIQIQPATRLLLTLETLLGHEMLSWLSVINVVSSSYG